MYYKASDNRYSEMRYRRCGRSGIMLPAVSLGLWHNFGGVDIFENGRAIVREAFDRGITYFDLANNYGPPPGSAERFFGEIMRTDFAPYRDELIISTKAGYTMWDGPYGDWGSRKYLVSSLDQSLKRMGLDYVDIFYSHRYDPGTPIEETMSALDHIVRSGKALYAGISNYPPEKTAEAAAILSRLGTPCLVDQVKYSLLVRSSEDLWDVHEKYGMGCVSFSPLAQGQLTDKYLNGIPENSRAAKVTGYLKTDEVLRNIDKIRRLREIAARRGQTLAQMAIAWQLYDNRVTSVIIGASSVEQIGQNISALENISFSTEELNEIDTLTK